MKRTDIEILLSTLPEQGEVLIQLLPGVTLPVAGVGIGEGGESVIYTDETAVLRALTEAGWVQGPAPKKKGKK